jgi:four helix bundle protein
MEVTKRFVAIADWVWSFVRGWKPFERDTVGKQLVRSADSVGANLIEGGHRHTDADALHFFVTARASAEETIYWLERAAARGLGNPSAALGKVEELREALRMLEGLIAFRRSRMKAKAQRRTAEP